MISSPQIIRDNVESVVVITVIVLLVILCLVMLAFCGWRMTACSFIKLKTSHHDVGHDASHQLIRAPYHPGVIPDPLYHAQYEVIDLCQISSPYDQVTLSRDPRHCVTLRVDCFGGKWHLPEWGLGLYIAPQASLSLGAEHTLLISVDSSFQLGQLKFHQTPKRSAVLSSMVHVHWLESSASSRPVTIAVPHWLPEQAMGNVKIDLVHMEESFKQQNATFAVGKESFFVLLYHPSTTFALVNHLNAAETPPSSRYRLVVYAHEVDCPAETSIIIFCYIIHDSDDVEYRLQLELNKQFMGDPPKFVQRHTNMVLLDDGQLMLCIGCQDIDAGWHCAMADIYQEVSMANILDDSKHHCLYKVTLVPDSETPPDHDFMFHIVLFQKHHFHQPTKIPCRPLPKLKMKKQFPRPELLWQSVPKSDVQIEVDIQEIEETLANVKSPHDWMMLTQILGFQYVSLPPLPLPNGDISSSAHSLYSLLQVKQTGLRSTISPHVPL